MCMCVCVCVCACVCVCVCVFNYFLAHITLDFFTGALFIANGSTVHLKLQGLFQDQVSVSQRERERKREREKGKYEDLNSCHVTSPFCTDKEGPFTAHSATFPPFPPPQLDSFLFLPQQEKNFQKIDFKILTNCKSEFLNNKTTK